MIGGLRREGSGFSTLQQSASGAAVRSVGAVPAFRSVLVASTPDVLQHAVAEQHVGLTKFDSKRSGAASRKLSSLSAAGLLAALRSLHMHALQQLCAEPCINRFNCGTETTGLSSAASCATCLCVETQLIEMHELALANELWLGRERR